MRTAAADRLKVEWARTRDPLFEAWTAAGKAAGHPVSPDYNGAGQEGFGRSQSTIGGGRRSSAAVAYLHPALSPPNLTLRVRAMALRVVIEGTRAVGVEYEQRGRIVQARAEREVILCGGAFNSPQLLLLSGIGEADHLRKMGIEPVIDLPTVGANLQDHLMVVIHYSRSAGGRFREVMRFDRMAIATLRAHFFRTGPATVLPGGLYGFVKTRPELAVPDLQFLFRGLPPEAHLWFPGIRPTASACGPSYFTRKAVAAFASPRATRTPRCA